MSSLFSTHRLVWFAAPRMVWSLLVNLGRNLNQGFSIPGAFFLNTFFPGGTVTTMQPVAETSVNYLQ